MSEFMERYGLTPEEAADKFAPACQGFLNTLRDADCPPDLAAFLGARIAEGMLRETGGADMAAMIAMTFIMLHLELGGVGFNVMEVPPPAELN